MAITYFWEFCLLVDEMTIESKGAIYLQRDYDEQRYKNVIYQTFVCQCSHYKLLWIPNKVTNSAVDNNYVQ